MKEIILTVDMNGQSKIETKGFKGKACLKASKFLEESLGAALTNQFKPEYYEFDGSQIVNKLTINAK